MNIKYARKGSQYLHRLLTNAPADLWVDHKDQNPLNNSLENLRLCTRAQNLWNVGKKSHNSSGYKGVYFCKQTGRWRAEISANKRRVKLGRFKTKEDAAIAYDKAAIVLHGEFAYLNFPTYGEKECSI